MRFSSLSLVNVYLTVDIKSDTNCMAYNASLRPRNAPSLDAPSTIDLEIHTSNEICFIAGKIATCISNIFRLGRSSKWHCSHKRCFTLGIIRTKELMSPVEK